MLTDEGADHVDLRCRRQLELMCLHADGSLPLDHLTYRIGNIFGVASEVLRTRCAGGRISGPGVPSLKLTQFVITVVAGLQSQHLGLLPLEGENDAKAQLGKSNLELSAIGLGCMGMSFSYGPWESRDSHKIWITRCGGDALNRKC
jgi:hypothetical protein